MNKNLKDAALLLMLVPGTLIACNGNGNATSGDTTGTGAKDTATSATNPPVNAAQSTATTQDSSNVTGPMTVSEGDRAFMSAVAEGGMTEIQASQAAENQAASPRVKSFAMMMVQDHSHWGDQLGRIAKGRNVMLPTSPSVKQQQALNTLKQKQGADFDKAYMKMMVHDHEGVVHDFQHAGGLVKDSALAHFVSDHLPMIQVHLDSAKAIEKGM